MLSIQTSAKPNTVTWLAPLTEPQSTIGTVTSCDSFPVIDAGRLPAVISELTADDVCPQSSPVLVAMTSPTLTSQVHPFAILVLRRVAPPPFCGPCAPVQPVGM